MSVQSEVTRLTNAKSALKTSIENKGVTVPTTTKLEGYSALVDAIQTGSSSGIPGLVELYSNKALSITYTSTSAGTAKTLTGLSGIQNYPVVICIIENTNASGTLKFIRNVCILGNPSYMNGAIGTFTRYGIEHYYNSSGALAQMAGTSYGLWGYTYTTGGNFTIRGRCNSNYFTSLTGTYKVKILALDPDAIWA